MIKKCNYCGTVNYFNSTGYCKNCDRELPDKNDSKATDFRKAKPDKNPLIQTLEETVMEINEDFHTTIDHLIAQNGICRDVDGSKRNLSFECDKQGDIIVAPADNDHTYFVTAKVYAEGGKTKIAIQSKKRRTVKTIKILSSMFSFFLIIAAVIYVIVKKTVFSLTTGDICVLLIAVFMLFNTLLNINTDNKNATSDLQIMKGEVIRRIKAVERWYD